MDRAVAVRLRLADVVLEPPRHRPPAQVHGAERDVAVADRAGDDPEAVDVGEPVEALLLLLHLAPDRVGLLLATDDLGLDAGLAEHGADVLGDLGDDVACLAAHLDEAADDRLSPVRVQDAEGDVLELLAHPLHAHPAGERAEDVHGLARLALLLLGLEVADGPHVVQPVGELDEQDPQVLRHRHQQLAEVLGLLVLDRRQLEVGQLGHPVDQLRDLVAEPERDLGIGRERVLDGVVQQRRDDRRVVELLLGEQHGDRHRMAEVGLAARCGTGPRASAGRSRRPPRSGHCRTRGCRRGPARSASRPGSIPSGPGRAATAGASSASVRVSTARPAPRWCGRMRRGRRRVRLRRG